jgi:hypothetical protein
VVFGVLLRVVGGGEVRVIGGERVVLEERHVDPSLSNH